MDSEQFNNLVNNISNVVTQLGQTAGNIYSSFHNNNVGNSNNGVQPVVVHASESSLPSWLLPVGVIVGLFGLVLIFKNK